MVVFFFSASQQRIMLETASIAGGATIAILLVFILCFVVYIHYKRRAKQSRASTDCVDSPSITLITRPTFGTRWRNPPQADLPIPHDRGDSKQNKVELHQVTTIKQCTNNRDMWSFYFISIAYFYEEIVKCSFFFNY